MNTLEIEEAVSQLSVVPFEPENFPYAFLEAFGNKTTEIQRFKNGNSNRTDIEGAISEPSAGPLFSDQIEDDDLEAGTIYVLRSKSDHP